MEDIVLYFVAGMLGAELAKEIRGGEVRISGFVVAVFAFFLVQILVLLAMVVRSLVSCGVMRFFDCDPIDFSVAFYCAFWVSMIVYVAVRLMRYFENEEN